MQSQVNPIWAYKLLAQKNFEPRLSKVELKAETFTKSTSDFFDLHNIY